MYEFSADENKVFERLVKNLKSTGLAVAAASVLLLAYHVVSYLGVGLGKEGGAWIVYVDYALWGGISILGIVVGFLLVKATAAFAALINTEGDDLAHLMQGISRLVNLLRVVDFAAVGAALLLAASGTFLVVYS